MSTQESGESSHRTSHLHDQRSSLGDPSSHGNASASASSPSSTRPSGEFESVGGSTLSAGSGVAKRRRGGANSGGGFLLADSFGRKGGSYKGSPSSEREREGKGKSRVDGSGLRVLKRRRGGEGKLNGSVGSSPLAKVMISDRQEDERDKSRTSMDTDETPPRVSEEAPTSQEPTPAVGAIDPAQIVNMALSLSESRRRHLTPGQLPQQPLSGRRVTSAGTAVASPQLQGGYQAYGPGGSLRQYLNQQRRISRTASPPIAGRRVSTAARHLSSSYAAAHQSEVRGLPDPALAPTYNFSPATLARVEKAKQYIELSDAHRHLLELLPPLKPDATAPGNSVYSASSVPGTPNFELKRIASHANEKHPLGRQYNPLQLIRNRKLRARTRLSLNPCPEEFESVDQVSKWTAAVEEIAKNARYRGADQVTLPKYPLGSDAVSRADQSTIQNGHRRNESSGAARKRPRTDWHFTPAELLAEAYWLEQGDNKLLIENRHGNKVFPAREVSAEGPARHSYESKRSATSVTPSIEMNDEDGMDGDSRHSVDRGRKRHLPRHIDGGSKLKHVFNKARGRSRSTSSDLSTSDQEPAEGNKRLRLPMAPSIHDNIGPLERQMVREADAGDGDSKNRLEASPGTPNKWGNDPHFGRSNQSPANGEIVNRHHPMADIDVADWERLESTPPDQPLQDYKQAEDHTDEPRRSIEDVDSSVPDTPASMRPYPGIGADLTTPPPRNSIESPFRKSRKGFLPFGKPDGNRDSRKHGVSGAFGNEAHTDQGSRQTSAEEAPPRISLDSMGSPDRRNKLFPRLTNESTGSFIGRPSSRGKETKDGKEQESAVRRFFKGGRLGEIVRNEGARFGSKKDSPQSPLRDDFDYSDNGEALEESDTDGDIDSVSAKGSQAPNPTTTGASNNLLSPPRIEQPKPRYHLDNLPTFRSSTAKTPSDGSRPSTPNQDHISAQQNLLRQRNRSPRLDRLAPPSLDISRVSTRTSTGSPSTSTNLHRTMTGETSESKRSTYGLPYFFHGRSRSKTGKRLAAILDVPGQVGRGGLPPTGLAPLRPEKSRSSSRRPKLSDKRHWSISDDTSRRPSKARPELQLKRQNTSVNRQDIERVRTLLWCSGIKAAELARRAARPHQDGPSPFLLKAAQTTGRDREEVRDVPAKEEFALAGRLLVEATESDVAALHDSARQFRDNMISQLTHRIGDLRGVVESLSERARAMGDGATGFGAEVTGKRAMEVRVVMDALDKLARKRRRRLRWVRRVGFGALEWVVLTFMWGIWFCVVCVRGVWRCVRVVVAVIRWIFWLD